MLGAATVAAREIDPLFRPAFGEILGQREGRDVILDRMSLTVAARYRPTWRESLFHPNLSWYHFVEFEILLNQGRLLSAKYHRSGASRPERSCQRLRAG